MPQSLMDLPDAVESTTYLTPGQEQQPEWEAQWNRGTNSVKMIHCETTGVLIPCLAGPAMLLLWSELLGYTQLACEMECCEEGGAGK